MRNTSFVLALAAVCVALAISGLALETTAQPIALGDTETVMGYVSEYNDGADSFVLATSDHREITIRTDPSTTRVSGPRLSGLMLGDRVTAECRMEDTDYIAITVNIE